MLLNVLGRRQNGFSFGNEWNRIQNELTENFFSGGGLSRDYYNPPVNVYVNRDDIVLTALVPGYDPSEIELLIIENKVQIKGTKKSLDLPEGTEVHRQEILSKDFERSLELPFRVNSDKAEAKFKNGILSVKLPKAEADKPKKIAVQIENS